MVTPAILSMFLLTTPIQGSDDCYAFGVAFFGPSTEVVESHALVTYVFHFRRRDYESGCWDQQGAASVQLVEALRAEFPDDWHRYSSPTIFAFDSEAAALRARRKQVGELQYDWLVETFDFEYYQESDARSRPGAGLPASTAPDRHPSGAGLDR